MNLRFSFSLTSGDVAVGVKESIFGGLFWIVRDGEVFRVPKSLPSFGLQVKYHTSSFVVRADETVSVLFSWSCSDPFLYHRISVPF